MAEARYILGMEVKMSVDELEEQYCRNCDINNVEATLEELDYCWRCAQYYRFGIQEMGR
jgi:hypothetical protein